MYREPIEIYRKPIEIRAAKVKNCRTALPTSVIIAVNFCKIRQAETTHGTLLWCYGVTCSGVTFENNLCYKGDLPVVAYIDFETTAPTNSCFDPEQKKICCVLPYYTCFSPKNKNG